MVFPSHPDSSRKRWSNIRLRWLLVFPFVIEIVAITGLVGYLSFRNGQQSVESLVDKLLIESSNRVHEFLSEYMSMPKKINEINVDAFETGAISLNDFQSMERIFWKQLQVYRVGYINYANEVGNFIGVTFDPKDHNHIVIETFNRSRSNKMHRYRSDNKGKRLGLFSEPEEYEFVKQPWYADAKKAGKPVWSEIYQWGGGGGNEDFLATSCSYPVYDRAGAFVGVMGIDMTLSQISDFLRKLKVSLSRKGKIFIIEDDGLLVAHSIAQSASQWVNGQLQRVSAVDSQDPIIQKATQRLKQKYGEFDTITTKKTLKLELNSDLYFVQVTPWKDDLGLDWLVVMVVPQSDFMAQINANTRTTIMVCIAALGVAILFGLLTSQWIAQPILRLCQVSKSISEGNLTQQVIPSNINSSGINIVEITTLNNSFTSMVAQLQTSFKALIQSKEDLRLANEKLEQRVKQRTAELETEKERAEQLLLNILPEPVANQLKQSGKFPAEHFEEATILFADIVGFTNLATRIEPLELVNKLNNIFSSFDHLANYYGLEKIKTIGDAYMVVGGLPIPREDHVIAIANMALDMQTYIQTQQDDDGKVLKLRIGINTGPVVAGVIGLQRFIYDLWGDAVNVASRMESHGEPGNIQVTEATYQLLKDRYYLEKRGTIFVKGRGEMTTYWLLGKR